MLTKQAAKRLCRFMEYTSGSWRNAIYIDSKLLLWETDASEPCGIRQIFSSSFGPY